jgi:hypothetical protein
LLRASLVATLAFSTWATGQSTQPSAPPPPAPAPAASPAPAAPETPAWSQVVAHLADQLSSKDLPALRSAVGNTDVLVRSFSSDNPSTLERLLASTMQAKLIGTHAYPKLPMSLATDLASDFRNAADTVPEAVQKDMVPADPAAEKKANDTAAAWLAQVVQPVQNRAIGVIVFWPTDRRTPGDTGSRRAIFVVVRAQQINGEYVIQQIRFGDPLETPR